MYVHGNDVRTMVGLTYWTKKTTNFFDDQVQ